jgi:hypothetical protein
MRQAKVPVNSAPKAMLKERPPRSLNFLAQYIISENSMSG